jgi:hypothetical protein
VKPQLLNWQELRGRIVVIDFTFGRHLVRVVKVKAGPRSGLRSVRVAFSSYEGRRADGSERWGWRGGERVVRDPKQIVGVFVRRQTIGVEEFLGLRTGRARLDCYNDRRRDAATAGAERRGRAEHVRLCHLPGRRSARPSPVSPSTIQQHQQEAMPCLF